MVVHFSFFVSFCRPDLKVSYIWREPEITIKITILKAVWPCEYILRSDTTPCWHPNKCTTHPPLSNHTLSLWNTWAYDPCKKLVCISSNTTDSNTQITHIDVIKCKTDKRKAGFWRFLFHLLLVLISHCKRIFFCYSLTRHTYSQSTPWCSVLLCFSKIIKDPRT